jgi:type II secretory pathway component GspD/PulD (secretin)
MKKFLFLFFCTGMMLLKGADDPSAPRDSNFQRTGAYAPTRVEAKLVIPVRENTDTLHFIRDNNDPRVITKTYEIRHADAYEIRDCLREMVQSKRVGNTALQQIYPGNTQPTPAPYNTATLSAVQPVTPVTAQPTFNPALQLGSNTAVECLKYVDGTGLLLISAEDYRFADRPGGMGFDSIVKFLDRPQMGAVTGTQLFFYFPKYVPARNLQNLIQNVGMNIPDVTELWQGGDAVAYDPGLNLLIFDVANYSMTNIEKMLTQYDVPIPQLRLKIKVYEFFTENDDKIGVDFQAWKNNGGMDLFTGGGRFRDNWSALQSGGMGRTGSERTGFYNFNPKWNTRYLDFLTSKGKGKVLCSSELLIRNNTPAQFSSKRELFYFEARIPAEESQWIKFFSALADKVISSNDIPIWKAPPQQTLKQSSFGFSLSVANASVTENAANFTLTLSNSSLLGFGSDGSPRLSESRIDELNITLPNGKNSFIIGGLRKISRVKSKTGIPFLKDIPVLGWLFSTESDSYKKSVLVVTGECSGAAHLETPSRRISKGELH